MDAIAHRWASGRWLATGGGGYDAYRVVPRTWALTWLAGAHREPDEATPAAWRDRWDDEAARSGRPGCRRRSSTRRTRGSPSGTSRRPRTRSRCARWSASVASRSRRSCALAEDRGWWTPSLTWAGRQVHGSAAAGAADRAGGRAAVRAPAPGLPLIQRLSAAELPRSRSRRGRSRRSTPPTGWRSCAARRRRGTSRRGDRRRRAHRGRGGRAGGVGGFGRALLAVGVAPAYRRRGLGRAILGRLVADRPAGLAITATINSAEHDVVEPLDVALRIDIAGRLLRGAGFDLPPVSPDIRRDDPWAIVGRLPG